MSEEFDEVFYFNSNNLSILSGDEDATLPVLPSKLLETVPIATHGRRRKSGTNGLSGSIMDDASWAGMPMGSFSFDNTHATGTSRINVRSAMLDSLSYVPQMGEEYLKDYVCCGTYLPSMHDLLQHDDEAHAAHQRSPLGSRTAAQTTMKDIQQTQAQQSNTSPFSSAESCAFGGFVGVDLDRTFPSTESQARSQCQLHLQFGRFQPRRPVDASVAHALQHHGQLAFPRNPVVSCVNTPVLFMQAAVSEQKETPQLKAHVEGQRVLATTDPTSMEAQLLRDKNDEVRLYNKEQQRRGARGRKHFFSAERLFKHKDLVVKGTNLDFVWYAFRIYQDTLFPYVQQLRDNNPGKRVVIIEDNSPVHHKARRLMAPLINHLAIEFAGHPAFSPDLNPIETLHREQDKLIFKFRINTFSAA